MSGRTYTLYSCWTECDFWIRFSRVRHVFSPSGWNRFQPQIDPVQNSGTFLRTVIEDLPSNNQVENSFVESVSVQSHVLMLTSQPAQSLKSYGHFRTLGSRSFSVTTMLIFSGRANASIHALGEDDTAKALFDLHRSQNSLVIRFASTNAVQTYYW